MKSKLKQLQQITDMYKYTINGLQTTRKLGINMMYKEYPNNDIKRTQNILSIEYMADEAIRASEQLYNNALVKILKK